MTSYTTQVIADSSGKWTGNDLTFATEAEAKAYVSDLEWRWTSVRQTRVVESDRPVNSAWVDGKRISLRPGGEPVAEGQVAGKGGGALAGAGESLPAAALSQNGKDD